jgi:hypothetical protein
MNTLPQHRQIIFGRTAGRTWDPADSDPIRFYPATTRADKVYGVILAIAIGIGSAMLLAHWWSS